MIAPDCDACTHCIRCGTTWCMEATTSPGEPHTCIACHETEAAA